MLTLKRQRNRALDASNPSSGSSLDVWSSGVHCSGNDLTRIHRDNDGRSAGAPDHNGSRYSTNHRPAGQRPLHPAPRFQDQRLAGDIHKRRRQSCNLHHMKQSAWRRRVGKAGVSWWLRRCEANFIRSNSKCFGGGLMGAVAFAIRLTSPTALCRHAQKIDPLQINRLRVHLISQRSLLC